MCTPNLNNPTVSLMPDSRRQEIAEIARRFGVHIIEDDVYGPLLGGSHARPLSSYAPELSFYCTSMTKSVLTGLRVGYLAMPKRLALRTESILRVNSWMATPLVAEIASRWINDGRAAQRLHDRVRHLGLRHLLLGDLTGDVGTERRLPRGPLGVVAPRHRDGGLDEALPRGRVADDDELGALAVAAARREARVLEDGVEHLVGQRVVGELPDRGGRAHDVIELHGSQTSHGDGLVTLSSFPCAASWR